MVISRERQGELFVLGEAFLWGMVPIVSIFSFSFLPPLFVLAGATFFSSVFFAVIVTIQKTWGAFRIVAAWKYIFLNTGIVGIGYFSVFFLGLQYTTAGNASIFALFEVFFTFLLFSIWKRDSQQKTHALGAVFMLIGAVLILFPGEFHVQKGDLLIILATMLPPLGNYFQKEARKLVSAPFLLFIRSFISVFFLFFLASFVNSIPEISAMWKVLPVLILNGVFLFGLRNIFWVEALFRISISKTLALSSVAPLFTLIFSFFLLGEIPSIWQIGGLVPIMIGVYFLTKNSE